MSWASTRVREIKREAIQMKYAILGHDGLYLQLALVGPSRWVAAYLGVSEFSNKRLATKYAKAWGGRVVDAPRGLDVCPFWALSAGK